MWDKALCGETIIILYKKSRIKKLMCSNKWYPNKFLNYLN